MVVMSLPGSIYDCESDPNTVLLELDVDGLDPNGFLDVSCRGGRDLLVRKNIRLAEGVDEGGTTCA